MKPLELWERYKAQICVTDSVGFWLDTSRMLVAEDALRSLAGPMRRAFAAMDALEGGGIANPDERRMVGHYWLRAPEMAPTPEITRTIQSTLAAIESFAATVRAGRIRPSRSPRFRHLLVIGIGGSALGPQFVSDALGAAAEPMQVHFIDNTDPEGIERLLSRLGAAIDETLTIVISKSGGTKETRNGMLEVQEAYRSHGLPFGSHAVAVTGEASELDRFALAEGFLARFPMWDWVGGRTSVTSAVGLLPAALQGIAIRDLLEGARAMDAATRVHDERTNPAARLAMMWHLAGGGRGSRDMVVLPYCDRLLLFSRYLQQLVMESLGKEKDLSGRTVNQGLAVYGNKGSTDQHAYVQQLRDGLDNFFAVFIEVLEERAAAPLEVEPGATSGDFLAGFLLGTREALYERRRSSMTLTVPDRGAQTIGALIALFERTVGLYSSLINVNAYNQPGVEAGKKAAAAVLALQQALLKRMRAEPGTARTAADWAESVGQPERAEVAFKVLFRLAANPRRGVARSAGPSPVEALFSASP